MNLPNKLTILRVILVPVFLVFLLIDSIPLNFLWATIVFAVSSITDTLDGHIARKHNLITNFGKFLDPLADKILVLSALISFIKLGLSGAVPVIIVVAREFLVTSIRLVAAADGTVIAASIYGKIKTVIQMFSIVAILIMLTVNSFVTLNFDIELVSNILMWVTAAITVISGIDYLIKNKSCIDTTK